MNAMHSGLHSRCIGLGVPPDSVRRRLGVPPRTVQTRSSRPVMVVMVSGRCPAALKGKAANALHSGQHSRNLGWGNPWTLVHSLGRHGSISTMLIICSPANGGRPLGVIALIAMMVLASNAAWAQARQPLSQGFNAPSLRLTQVLASWHGCFMMRMPALLAPC